MKYGNVAQFGNAGGYKAGDIRIRDVDGNGYINEGANTVSNPGDKVKLGNSTPRYSYGITLTASWNGIDLYMLFQGIGSKDWYPPGETTLFWVPTRALTLHSSRGTSWTKSGLRRTPTLISPV